MTRRSPTINWREAVRDSDLDTTAKAVAFTLSTYMNGKAEAFPSKVTLAEGASVSKRAADGAIDRLEQSGFLHVARTKGRASNRYSACTPTVQADAGLTVQADAGFKEGNRANGDTQPCKSEHPTVQVAAPEVVEIEERSRRVRVENCTTCGGSRR